MSNSRSATNSSGRSSRRRSTSTRASARRRRVPWKSCSPRSMLKRHVRRARGPSALAEQGPWQPLAINCQRNKGVPRQPRYFLILNRSSILPLPFFLSSWLRFDTCYLICRGGSDQLHDLVDIFLHALKFSARQIELTLGSSN